MSGSVRLAGAVEVTADGDQRLPGTVAVPLGHRVTREAGLPEQTGQTFDRRRIHVDVDQEPRDELRTGLRRRTARAQALGGAFETEPAGEDPLRRAAGVDLGEKCRSRVLG